MLDMTETEDRMAAELCIRRRFSKHAEGPQAEKCSNLLGSLFLLLDD